MEFNKRLSNITNSSILLKREDVQQIRSFKIRGAYNKISSLDENDFKNGIVCASAGNHAQGFAFSCKKLKINGEVYMPATTPQQKISQVRMFGGDYIDIKLVGDTYDACQTVALNAAKKFKKYLFILLTIKLSSRVRQQLHWKCLNKAQEVMIT